MRENVEKLGEHEIRLLETENGVFESLKRDEFWLLMKENERQNDLKIRERVQELEVRMVESLAKINQRNVRELHVEEKVEQRTFDQLREKVKELEVVADTIKDSLIEGFKNEAHMQLKQRITRAEAEERL